MIVTRHGNCEKCGIPINQSKEFIEVIDMFNPDVPKGTITPELEREIKLWRKRPIRCDNHPKVKI